MTWVKLNYQISGEVELAEGTNGYGMEKEIFPMYVYFCVRYVISTKDNFDRANYIYKQPYFGGASMLFQFRCCLSIKLLEMRHWGNQTCVT